MPGKPEKPYRIRVRVLDGKPREPDKLKGQLVPHVDVIDAKDRVEFVLCAVKDSHFEAVRAKLGAAGLEEVVGGETTVAAVPSKTPPRHRQAQRRGPSQEHGGPRHQRRREPPPTTAPPLPGKPYGFVALPDNLTTAPPVWLDGTSSQGRLSGEIRFELETLTPLLVGWERRQIVPSEAHANEPWPVEYDELADGVSMNLHGRWSDSIACGKSVLCPLRAPWESRPVVIPGDSLKGLLRHELGALLGAPMERVAERSYSYRPNSRYPDSPANRRLEPRLGRVMARTEIAVDGAVYPVPSRLDVLAMATRDDQSYYPRRQGRGSRNIIQPPAGAEPYRGGMGGGTTLPEACLSPDAQHRIVHTHIDIEGLRTDRSGVAIRPSVLEQYGRTLQHLFADDHGHFSGRHPQVGNNGAVRDDAIRALRDAALRAFQPHDIVWVEWDTDAEEIVSFGWHYYYRWAYMDSVRRSGGRSERHGLVPLEDECSPDDDHAPRGLSPVRRLFGYTSSSDNEGSAGIGEEDHAQLMGRVSVNAALEVVEASDTEGDRFLPPTFLKELGMPRPSAVEHYIRQPHHPNQRPSDQASLVTYGDAAGYDAPGELAGRKFYLDRKDAYNGKPWEDNSPANRLNDRSTLALDASKRGRRFRFTVRFRDLDATELAAIHVALCPHQFREALGGKHPDGYCSKLGYARPLGWGSVRVEAKALFLLDTADTSPTLNAEPDLVAWVRENHQHTAAQADWLAVHRHKHPNAADYPRARDRDGNENIYTFHTGLRATHSRDRRYRRR